jgi:hypothetical protein
MAPTRPPFSKRNWLVVPGLLEGQLAQQLYAGFRGKLLRATLRQSTASASGGLDSFGDRIADAIETYPCQGFVEGYDAAYRKRAEIPETDSKVNIFAASLPAGISPGKDDEVQMPAMTGPWWQLRQVQTDPATALWICQAYQIRAPS